MSELTFTHAIGVTDADGVLWTQGDDTAIFPLASVSKPIAALATLVAIDQGKLALDEPAGPRGATIRHLLAHTAGYAFDTDDLLAEPGQKRLYSNTGFDVLGEALAEAVHMPVADWVRSSVVEPLGLRDLQVEGSPAKDYSGSIRDLLALGREWLSPTVISAELWQEATSIQFPGVRGILPGYGNQKNNTWGLGVEIRSDKSPHWTSPNSAPETFGHFGQSGSFLWMDPTRTIAAAFLGEKPFGPEHQAAWPEITRKILHFMDKYPTNARERLAEIGAYGASKPA